MKEKPLSLRERAAILGGFALVGFVIWEFVLAYAYFALPVWGFGVLIAVHWGLQSLKKKHPKRAKILRGGIAVILVLCLLFFCTVEGLILSGAKGAENPDCDYILVLGAAVRGKEPSRSLAERLQAALDYLNTYPDAVCVVSGGMGWGEDISEADCMAAWLEAHGMPTERILREDKATSTWENLNFTLDLIQEETGTRPDRLAVVSSEYHLYRASLMAKEVGIEFLGVPATTHPWLNRIHYYFREFFGVVHFWILGS